MEELTHAQQVFIKMRSLFPEDPDGIRAKRELKKREDDERRQMLIRRRKELLTNQANLAKAREARQVKPKTVGRG